MQIDPNDRLTADSSTEAPLAQPGSPPQQNAAQRRLSAFWPFATMKRRRRQMMAEAIYSVIVEQSRQPVFYTSYGLADTPDNRREWIGCHAALVMMRLHKCPPEGGNIAQTLFDWMFADVEQNFREEGVSDMSISKHMRKASITFLARYKSIQAALEADDRESLAETIARNMALRSASDAAKLANYVAGAMRGLEKLIDTQVLAGQVAFDRPG